MSTDTPTLKPASTFDVCVNGKVVNWEGVARDLYESFRKTDARPAYEQFLEKYHAALKSNIAEKP